MEYVNECTETTQSTSNAVHYILFLPLNRTSIIQRCDFTSQFQTRLALLSTSAKFNEMQFLLKNHLHSLMVLNSKAVHVTWDFHSFQTR